MDKESKEEQKENVLEIGMIIKEITASKKWLTTVELSTDNKGMILNEEIANNTQRKPVLSWVINGKEDPFLGGGGGTTGTSL